MRDATNMAGEILLIYGFNEALNNISDSYLKVGDESMSVIRFLTTEKGNLTHKYYIFRNLGPMGRSSRIFPIFH